jgi:hypothetical protein
MCKMRIGRSKSRGEVTELCVRPKEGPIHVHSLEATVEDG